MTKGDILSRQIRHDIEPSVDPINTCKRRLRSEAVVGAVEK